MTRYLVGTVSFQTMSLPGTRAYEVATSHSTLHPEFPIHHVGHENPGVDRINAIPIMGMRTVRVGRRVLNYWSLLAITR